MDAESSSATSVFGCSVGISRIKVGTELLDFAISSNNFSTIRDTQGNIVNALLTTAKPRFDLPASPTASASVKVVSLGAPAALEDAAIRAERQQIKHVMASLPKPGETGGDGARPEVEVTAGQKMLSAVSGSVFTSLLVTPLDVVRVRLQSQTAPTPAAVRPSSFNAFSVHHAPSLGVTACCREVFWTANNSPLCFAAPTPAAAGAHAQPPLTPLSTLAHATPATPAACAVEETRRRTFTSTLDGLRKIARNEGPLALWRGLSPTLVMAVPGNVIYFTGYDALRGHRASPVRTHVPDAYAPLVAGSAARVAAAVVVSPIEMFRTRMQAASGGSGVFRDTLARLGELARAQGYASLWRGLSLTLWRDVPFSGLYWWGYETFRRALVRARHGAFDTGLAPGGPLVVSAADHATTFVDAFAAGAASGAVASIVTTPFDVGKTRQQVFVHAKDLTAEGASSSGLAAKAQHAAARGERMPEDRSMPRFLYHILRAEGLPGLFRGGVARCLKVAPACAIMISSYEIGKKMAQNANERSEREAQL